MIGCHAHARVSMFSEREMWMDESHRKKCRRFDRNGQAHCLTFSCFQRRPFFKSSRCCEWMLQALALGKDKQLFDLWAYVIMPEHVHLVLLPEHDVQISLILKTLKQSVSKRAIIWLEKNAPDALYQLEDRRPDESVIHRFWQRGGGYDRNLRSLSDVYEKIDYIHQNPLRRGLVQQADQWMYSSYMAWRKREKGSLINFESLPQLFR